MITCGFYFLRLGSRIAIICGTPVTRQSTENIIQTVRELPPGERVMVLAPIVRGRKGEFKKELDGVRTAGFSRVPALMAKCVRLMKTSHSTSAKIIRLI